MHEVVKPRFYCFEAKGATQAAKEKTEKIKRRKLGRKCFGRSHADFRAGMGIDHTISIAASCRTDNIADGDDRGLLASLPRA